MHSTFQHNNPARPVDWRWQRVLEMIDHRPRALRCGKGDDECIQACRKFMLLLRAEDGAITSQIYEEFPGLTHAYQAFTEAGDTGLKIQLESRILAKQTDAEISERLATIPGMVHWYEAIFFTVRDRLNARDWIVRQALQLNRGTNLAGGISPALRLFGYLGGPALLDYMAEGPRQSQAVPGTQAACDAFLDNYFSAAVRRNSAKAAAEMASTSQPAAMISQIVQMHMSMIAAERRDHGAAGGAMADFAHHVQETLSYLPLAVGSRAIALLSGQPTLKYDEYAAELNEDELLQVADGQELPNREEIAGLQMPPPITLRIMKEDVTGGKEKKRSESGD